MEALILAGGFGTRMRPLTYTRPKPLLPLANRPLIDWVLRSLPAAVDTVIVPVNYLSEQLRAHFEDHPDPRVVLVDEPKPLGTGGAVKAWQRHFTGPFLVLNADISSSLKLERLLRAHRVSGAEATISLWPVDDPSHFGVARVDDEGRILEFVEKPPRDKAPSRLINGGHYVLNPSILDRIQEGRFTSLEAETFTRMVAEGAHLHGHRFPGFWVDCGRPETYLEAHRRVLGRDVRSVVEGEGIRGLDQARFVSYSLGDRVSLGAKAHVEASVLLPDVRVGQRAVIEDSILGQGVEIGDRAHVRHCVLGDDVHVPDGSQWVGRRVPDPSELEAQAVIVGVRRRAQGAR